MVEQGTRAAVSRTMAPAVRRATAATASVAMITPAVARRFSEMLKSLRVEDLSTQAPACAELRRSSGSRVQDPQLHHILAPAKERAEQYRLLSGCSWHRRLGQERQAHSNLRFGIQRCQLGLERRETVSRIRLQDFEPSLFLRDRLEEFFAPRELSHPQRKRDWRGRRASSDFADAVCEMSPGS